MTQNNTGGVQAKIAVQQKNYSQSLQWIFSEMIHSCILLFIRTGIIFFQIIFVQVDKDDWMKKCHTSLDKQKNTYQYSDRIDCFPVEAQQTIDVSLKDNPGVRQ